MAFTAKVFVSAVELSGLGQKKITFSALYTDPDTGERVNQEWAQATPAFTCTMHVVNDVVSRNTIHTGQRYTLTFDQD